MLSDAQKRHFEALRSRLSMRCNSPGMAAAIVDHACLALVDYTLNSNLEPATPEPMDPLNPEPVRTGKPFQLPKAEACGCNEDHDVKDFVSGKMVPCKTCRPAEHELTRKVERLKDTVARIRDLARGGLRQVPKTDPYNALTDIAEECRRTAEKE